MERLTDARRSRCIFCEAADEGCAFAAGEFSAPCPDYKRYQRLAAIEDILGDTYDLDRLRELVEADRDGRCVVLPFRPPKMVYSCSKQFPIPEKTHYASATNILWDMDIGYVFGDTPEAAEAALKGES